MIQNDYTNKTVFNPSYCIRWYLYVWFFFFLFEAILPVESISGNKLQAVLASIDYVLVSAGTAWLFYISFRRKTVYVQKVSRGLNFRQLKLIILCSLVLSLSGFLLLWFDKIFIQKIDYSAGMAVAREVWRKAGEERQGVSSVASVLGYITGFSFYVTIAMIHLHWENLTKYYRYLGLFSGLLLLFGMSYLSGGRTIILLQIASMMSIGIIRRIKRISFLPGRKTTSKFIPLSIIFIAFVFSIYIFKLRAEMSNMDAKNYVSELVNFLGGIETDTFNSIENLGDIFADIIYLSLGAGVYLTHTLWSFQTVLDAEYRPGWVSLSYIMSLLAKIGAIQNASEPWLLAGNFISLPGALWYDFGSLGFLIAAIVHGILLGSAMVTVSHRKAGGIGVGWVIAVLISTILSPLVFAPLLMSFPFMLVSYVCLSFLGRLFWGKVSWLTFDENFKGT